MSEEYRGLDLLLYESQGTNLDLRRYRPKTLQVTGRKRIDLLDSYAHITLPEFITKVADNLECSISIYSLASDEVTQEDVFHKILSSTPDDNYESVPRSKARIMNHMVDMPPGLYVADLSGDFRRGGQQYVGAHIHPSSRRRMHDLESGKAKLIMNAMPAAGHTLTEDDLQFLRVTVPLISKDIQWAQLVALREHDEQGFINDKDQFYESVKNRIRSTGATGKRYGVLVTDLRDFEKFNKVAGNDVGDLVLEEMRERMRTIIRSGDVGSLKNYSFKMNGDGSLQIRESDETAQKGGDESIFIARTRNLGELVVLGRRLMQAVDDINVYDLFYAEQQRNPDFDAASKYLELCEVAPYMTTNGEYRLRLSTGVTMLQPPTDEEIQNDDQLSSYARRVVYQADMAMQEVKRLDKDKQERAIGYRILEPQTNGGSIYRPGSIEVSTADVIREMFNDIGQHKARNVSGAHIRKLYEEADERVDSILRANLEGQPPVRYDQTQRIPLSRWRSLRGQ